MMKQKNHFHVKIGKDFEMWGITVGKLHFSFTKQNKDFAWALAWNGTEK
jgi:hypothetical protein